MSESSTPSSQSTSDCHRKGLRSARKFGNTFLKRSLHFVIYDCVLKLKVVLFHWKFSFYLVWVSNVSHYLLLNTSIWFIMGDTVVWVSPASTESAQFPLVVLDVYYCHAFASQERQVMFLGWLLEDSEPTGQSRLPLQAVAGRAGARWCLPALQQWQITLPEPQSPEVSCTMRGVSCGRATANVVLEIPLRTSRCGFSS